MWRRFNEFQSLFSDTDAVTIRALPAETVARAHIDAGTAFSHRYAPALSDTALLHLSTDGTPLLGVWLHREGHLTSFYDVDTDAESEYAEAVVLGEDWEALLERLPRSSPYVAWWETADRRITETIEGAFDRLTAEHFAG